LSADISGAREPGVQPEKRTYCIAGLGNPGSKYESSPHNIGFLVVDRLAERHSIRISKCENDSLTGSGRIGDNSIVLVKPQTFMNLSGRGVAGVLKYRNLTHENLIVVYDELDLPWTALRIKGKGSAAGHNGVKSIIAALKTDQFIRVRVGIRPDHEIRDAADYVLAPMGRRLREEVDEIVSYTAEAVESIVAEGAGKAMAKYNRRAQGSKEEEE
jgi:peptidyl-tRNA hydrolase, PTH1 family